MERTTCLQNVSQVVRYRTNVNQPYRFEEEDRGAEMLVKSSKHCPLIDDKLNNYDREEMG